MGTFRFIFTLVFISITRVCSDEWSLDFITWPNETQAVVNETVKFLWKYYVKGVDVDIRWGTSKRISSKVSTFDKLFFYATEYEKHKIPRMADDIPERYRGRVQIVGQATLQIVNVTLEDEGEYLCEISDTGESWTTLSRAVRLHVLVPPKIVSRPHSPRLFSEGEQLKLECKARGKPQPQVSWYKGNMELVENLGSAEYFKRNISRWDNGNYKCVAKNNASQVEHTVQVIVHYKPVDTKIKTDATRDTLEEGEDLKIVCEAHAKPEPIFHLYHHSECGLGKEVSQVQKSRTGEFYLKNITSRQRGNYSCVPKNDVGQGEEASLRVFVRFSPKIKRLTSTKLNVTKNEPILISCDMEGYPSPQITWTKDGRMIASDERVFKIPHVDQSHQGIYTCTASNGISPDAQKSIRITVFYKPIIDSKRSSRGIAAQMGDSKELRCNATGNPLPSFEWKKGRETVGYKPTITISLLKLANFGEYTCEVTNSIGTTIHRVNIFKVDKPSIDELKVTKLESRSAHLTWKVGKSTSYPIERQELAYKGNKKEEKIILEGNKRSYKIRDLKPFSEYTVRLKVWNQYVTSDQAELLFHTTTARPGPPGEPRIQFRHSTSVRVTWNPPEEKNGKLVRYFLNYGIVNDSSSMETIKIIAPKTYVDVKDLKEEMLYTFKVKAATSSGPGEFSKSTEFRMNFKAPSIPEPINVTMPSDNVYQLVWNKPNLAGNLAKVLVSLEWKIIHSGKIGQDAKEILFRINTRTRRDVMFDWKAEVKDYGSKRVLALTDLFPNTVYKVSIKEGHKVEESILWTDETSAEIVTPEGVPSQPRDLTFDMLSDESALLSWKRPFYTGGELRKYVIFYGTESDKKRKELKSGLKNENVTMVIDGLNSKKKYDVQVQANSGKPGLLSYNVEFKQGSRILKVNVDSHSEDSFTVSWTKPSIPSAKIDDYRIYYRTVSGNWKSKDITSGLDNETLTAQVNGLTSGSVYQVKIQARTKRQVLLSEKQEVRSAIVQVRKSDETDYVPMFGGIIAGVLIFAFVIIIVAMFVRYNYRKRQRNQRRPGHGSHNTPNVLLPRSQENGHNHMSSPSDHLSSDSPGSEKCLRPDRKGNSVQVPLIVLSGSTKPIPVSNLLEYCTDHRKDGNKGFAEEFKSIDTDVKYAYEECKKPVNKLKNRYANIVTYDHTRVNLSNSGDNGSGYINANYIDGYNCPEKFIATQGPVATTFNDFWKMVWEQNCAAIVMVTNLIEKGKVKCQKYWPVTEAELFGSLTVNPIEEWELTDYTIRKFQLQQNNNSELTRDVTQFHYTAWPDHGVPVHPSRLLAFIRRVKNYSCASTGKILVHCSAGVGRTGTFIAIDALLDQMKMEGVVDIFKFVSHMRTQRCSMVQTEAQYSFIYEAVLEASVCGDTEIPVPDYAEKVQMLEQDDPDAFLSKEFQSLSIIAVNEKETCVNGLMPENQKKNRYNNSILPYDSNRVKLWPYPDQKGSDYINASFIDGYRNREIFIATQAPVKETVEDFWRMIWEYECYVLIMLLSEREDDDFQFLQYWPTQEEEYIIFGLLMITVESEEESDSYVKRTLKCTNTKSGEVRKIYHTNFLGWADHGVPVSASSLLNFIKDILKLEQRTGNGLTLVHCSDGSGRVGTFAAIYIAIERLKLESIIDLFSIVRNLRTQRIGMVENMEQYKFCYHALDEHIKSLGSQSY